MKAQKQVEFYGIQDFCAKSKVFKSKWTTVQFSTQENFLNKQEIHFKIPLPHLLHPDQLLPLQGPSQLLPGLCKQHNGEQSYHSGKKIIKSTTWSIKKNIISKTAMILSILGSNHMKLS